MDKLPKDVIIQIMKKLRTPDIVSFSSTCKKYSSIRSNDSRYSSFWIWKLKEDFKTKGDPAFTKYKCYYGTMREMRRLGFKVDRVDDPFYM